jgi:protein-tyrosine-phosphatase
MTNNPHDEMISRILFVCYGNACRSPIAEGLAKLILGEQIRNIDISHHTARSVANIQIALFEHIIVLDAYVFEALKNRYPSLSDRITLWDIEDPYGQDLSAYRKTAETIKNLIEKHLVPHYR